MQVGAYTITRSGDSIFFYAHPSPEVEDVTKEQAVSILKTIIDTEPKLYRSVANENDEYRQMIGFENYTIYCALPSFKCVSNENRVSVDVGQLADKQEVLDGLRVVAKNLLADIKREDLNETRTGRPSNIEYNDDGLNNSQEEVERV